MKNCRKLFKILLFFAVSTSSCNVAFGDDGVKLVDGVELVIGTFRLNLLVLAGPAASLCMMSVAVVLVQVMTGTTVRSGCVTISLAGDSPAGF